MARARVTVDRVTHKRTNQAAFFVWRGFVRSFVSLFVRTSIFRFLILRHTEDAELLYPFTHLSKFWNGKECGWLKERRCHFRTRAGRVHTGKALRYILSCVLQSRACS